MQFDFHSTHSIIVERGGAANLAKRIVERGGKSVLIVTDPGVLSAGLLNKALPQFKELELSLQVFSDVEADPLVSVIDSAVKLAQECKADSIVGFSGASSMDVDQLARDAMLQTRLLQNSPREITLADATALYREAL